MNGFSRFIVPNGIPEVNKTFLKRLWVNEDRISEIEKKTWKQSNCEEWKKGWKFRFTSSNFGLIIARKRHLENFVESLLHPMPFTSQYANHGIQYKTDALEQYQRYMFSIHCPVQVLKSGLVMSLDAPYLGASPDGVINIGCSSPFGLLEVKCPETKLLVTPIDAYSDSSFFLENVNGKAKLKHSHTILKCRDW